MTRAVRASPVTLAIFDLLWLDRRFLLDQAYSERRARLEELQLEGPHWVTPPTYDDGDALFAACEALGGEGVVVKARSGRYFPDTRTAGWVKRKCERWKSEHAPQRRPGSRRGPTTP